MAALSEFEWIPATPWPTSCCRGGGGDDEGSSLGIGLFDVDWGVVGADVGMWSMGSDEFVDDELGMFGSERGSDGCNCRRGFFGNLGGLSPARRTAFVRPCRSAGVGECATDGSVGGCTCDRLA